MNEATVIAYLRLLADNTFGAKRLSTLLVRFGSLRQAREQSASTLQQLGLNSKQGELLHGVGCIPTSVSDHVSGSLSWQNLTDQRIVTFESSDYPYLLKQIAAPPPLLFCHGDHSLLNQPACAIVGSRNATSYGLRQAKWFAAELAERGFTIVSGLAKGIDTVAHQGALSSCDRTIGVIGAGINVVYPKCNKQLHTDLTNRGLVVSEFLPGMPPKAMNFPQRNRIISGISLGAIVIEASLRSGSLITARMAMEQNRSVFAVPGPIDSELSAGCHRLLRDGASFAQTPDDVCDELIKGWHFEKQTVHSCENAYVKAKDTVTKGSQHSLSQIETELLKNISETSLLLDTVVESSQFKEDEVFAALLKLEMKGLIVNEAGRLTRVAQC